MIDKGKKGFVGSVFLIAGLLFSVSMGRVWAAPKEVSLPLVQVGEPATLKYGSYSCLAFMLPEGEKMKAEVYYSNGVPMGTLYGIPYYGCFNYSGLEGYEWKEGSREELLKGTEGLELCPAYKKLYGFQGFGELGMPSGMHSNYLIWNYERGADQVTITTEKEEHGRKRVLYCNNSFVQEKKAWFLYDENGELIRETEASGKTTVYDCT